MREVLDSAEQQGSGLRDCSNIVSSHPSSYMYNNRHPSATLSLFHQHTGRHTPIICCGHTAHACNYSNLQKTEMSSLPVGYVGLVVPVLPALERVDVCVHTGLATGHRTRHGETRGSGAVGRLSRRSVGWVGVTDRLEGTGFALCACVKWRRAVSCLPSAATLREKGEREGENRGCPPGFTAVSARRAALLARIVRSSRAVVGGAKNGAD